MANYQGAKFTAAYGTSQQLPASCRPEVSFAGRSNVGKSSLLNKLFGRKNLVKVSSTPGKTSTINFFEAAGIDFVDLPGYGFAKVGKGEKERWAELIEGYYAQDRRFALAVVLVDIRHDVSKLDVKMIEYLKTCGIPFIIAFTKADKLGGNQRRNQVRALCRQLAVAEDTYVVVCSSVKGIGMEDLHAIIDDAVSQERVSR